MELLEIYDKNGNPTGRHIERGNKNLKDDEFIKLAVLWIKCGNKFLIQKASPEKDGDYAVTGGHVPFGENSLNQACIELDEELGLIVSPTELKKLGTCVLGHGMFDTYLYINDNLESYNFTLQVEEVESVEFLTTEQIEELIEKGLFRKSSTAQYNQFIKNKF